MVLIKGSKVSVRICQDGTDFKSESENSLAVCGQFPSMLIDAAYKPGCLGWKMNVLVTYRSSLQFFPCCGYLSWVITDSEPSSVAASSARGVSAE